MEVPIIVNSAINRFFKVILILEGARVPPYLNFECGVFISVYSQGTVWFSVSKNI